MITTFTYDNANRLKTANAGGAITTYQHDAAGNRTAVLSPAGNTTYTWDAGNRLTAAQVSAGTVTFTYNADGQRVLKQPFGGTITGFLFDQQRLLNETTGAGGAINWTYSTATTDPFGDLLEENGQSFHGFDAQGNTNVLLDTTGAVLARYKYTAFGAMNAYRLQAGPWQQGNIDFSTLPPALVTHMLAGGQKQYYFDPETVLCLLGSGSDGRYYDPATARFLSQDAAGPSAADPNLYRYVCNDPINHLDPGGQSELSCTSASVSNQDPSANDD